MPVWVRLCFRQSGLKMKDLENEVESLSSSHARFFFLEHKCEGRWRAILTSDCGTNTQNQMAGKSSSVRKPAKCWFKPH